MKPLVSIGFVVRNSRTHYGSRVFFSVSETILNQTYPNLEILISDNASTDGTSDLCEELARRDSRIRVVHQAKPLTAQDNFIFAFHNTNGPYFTWMSDDDLRSLNFIEVLVEAMEERPEACLAFSDQREFSDHSHIHGGHAILRPFVTKDLSTLQRLFQMPVGSCTHVCYGLLRRQLLEGYDWRKLDNSSFDVPMGYYLSLRAEMIYAPGAVYYRYTPPTPRTVMERSRVNNYRLPSVLFPERVAWACSQAAAQALREIAHPVSPLRLFPVIYFSQRQGWKGIIRRCMPNALYAVWRSLKGRWLCRKPPAGDAS